MFFFSSFLVLYRILLSILVIFLMGFEFFPNIIDVWQSIILSFCEVLLLCCSIIFKSHHIKIVFLILMSRALNYFVDY